MPLRAVFFDLDDTLTDRWATIGRYAELFAQHFRGGLRSARRRTLRSCLWAADRGGHNPRRSLELLTCLRWRDAPSIAELDQHWNEHYITQTVARAGALQVIQTLRRAGLHVGVITDGFDAVQRSKLELTALWHGIDSCTTSETAGAAKPHARIFELACHTAGVEPADCLFIGDHPETDMIGAHGIGMHTVWLHIDGEGEWPPALAPRPPMITDLRQLFALPHASIVRTRRIDARPLSSCHL